MLLLSAVIQIVGVASAWYAVHTRRHGEASPSSSTTIASTTLATTITTSPSATTAEPMPPAVPHESAQTTTAPTHTPSANATKITPKPPSRQNPLPTDDAGAQTVKPLVAHKPPQNHPPASVDNTANTTPSTAATSAPMMNSNAASIANASPPETATHLLNVPIAQQSLSYRVQLSDGANSVELPPARLSSTHLGAQRYSVSLSNGTSQAGAGTFGWYDTFLMTEHGPNPLEIGGGLYIKSSDHPLRAALGLNLHDDGQTWHWGKKANIGTRTHAYFLDRVSLIVYIQGALRRSPLKGTTQWVLPLASDQAIRALAVQLNPTAAPNGIEHCLPCVQTQVRAHLGEMSYWSVWYDGSHNWKPVMMRMGLGNGGERVLSLIAQ